MSWRRLRWPGAAAAALVLALTLAQPTTAEPPGGDVPARIIDVDGQTVSARLRGERGSPVVLLAPMGSVGECWAEHAEALSRSHRVLTFDYPGMGDSPAQREPLTLDGLADLTADLIAASGW